MHVVDPKQTETVTPGQTYDPLHGTSGMRHVHADAELARLRDQVRGRPDPYVMFTNCPAPATRSGSSRCWARRLTPAAAAVSAVEERFRTPFDKLRGRGLSRRGRG